MKQLKIIIGFLFVSVLAYTQQLESYIQEGWGNNLNIQSFELRYAVAKEKIKEVNTLPNTQFGIGYFVSEPETRTGPQRAKFSIQQKLPWFGTITARENYSTAIAEAEYVDIVITKRKLALSISQSYYKLFAIQNKQKILYDNILLLQTYEKLALTSVEVGKASAVDVLKLQIRQNELEQHKAVLKENFLAEQIVFNALLNRDSGIDIILPDEMNIPLEDPISDNGNLQFNPELLKYDKIYESIKQLEVLNRKEKAPQIGFGLDYIPVSERNDVTINDNGKDIIMPMVSFSIPIFNKRYDSRTRQNKLHQQEITAQKEEQLNRMETILGKAISNRNTARIKYNTQKENLKQAKNAEEILIKNYETGTIDFNDVLDIQELQLKFQLNQIESVELYYRQAAIINYLTN
ncbi:transporter [Aquimarina atlantica]|uniref:Transporter n=1 Tax=Aquimarina atlantica TaxID=1317122 RepID=A0A023BZU9_9FLAO|nr:TolC family protein [Aquimarina atlantica]EZH75607.1 transporter [Aquimarina atlantica]